MDWLIKHIDEIDACLFTSDPSEQELKALERAMPRWQGRIKIQREEGTGGNKPEEEDLPPTVKESNKMSTSTIREIIEDRVRAGLRPHAEGGYATALALFEIADVWRDFNRKIEEMDKRIKGENEEAHAEAQAAHEAALKRYEQRTSSEPAEWGQHEVKR